MQRVFERPSIAHRPEIDGLRAVAVVPVILFHAGFEDFASGYLGVDIFFVISGYLITSIINDDIQQGRFSILRFYERRARRILPALFVVLAGSALAAWRILTPEQLDEFGESLIAASLFYSNFYFYWETGYFATAAELQPLLHTWSLSIEEQFYIIYPSLLLLLASSRRVKATAALSVLIIASLVAAEWTSRTNAELSFFAFHTRVFELLIGAVVALNRHAIERLDCRLQNMLAWLGLLGCFASFSVFVPTSHHPGLSTLVPVVSTALIIAFARNNNLPGLVLSCAPLVGIGLISYSLYLWHQPVFAFYRLYHAREIAPEELLIPAVGCFVLAAVSWRFVERPFRRPDQISRKILVPSSAAFISVPLLVGLFFHATKGLPQRMGPEANEIFAQIQSGKEARHAGIRTGECHFNATVRSFENFITKWNCLPQNDGQPQVKLLTFGDSHSADKAWALRLAGVRVGNLGGAGCPLYPTAARPECMAMINRVLDLAQKGFVSGIILANNWQREELLPSTLENIATFWKKAGVPILIFTQMPNFTLLKEQIARRSLRNESIFDIPFDQDHLATVDQTIRRVFSNAPFTIIDTHKIFCGPENVDCSAFENGMPLLIDPGHLSPLGAKRFGARIVADPIWKNWINSLRVVP